MTEDDTQETFDHTNPVEVADAIANVVDTMNEPDQVNHNITESADKIRVETKVKRGTGTRDQDTITVKVKGDDPDAVVERLNATVENLRETADAARSIQPDEPEGEADG